MSVPTAGDGERRRSPRFACSGEAKIVRLPSNGLLIPGRMRDLSLGGCYVETTSALDCGVRTEIVVRINSASFRAVSQVKEIRDRFGVGMEFLRMSARGKDMLAEVVEELAKWQALVNQLRSARRGAEAEVLLRELERQPLHALLVSRCLPVLRAVPSPERHDEAAIVDESESSVVKARAQIVPVDLFI